MKNRKFESYILKNRIPGIILSLIMVGCMIIMAWHFSLPDRIRSRTCLLYTSDAADEL